MKHYSIYTHIFCFWFDCLSITESLIGFFKLIDSDRLIKNRTTIIIAHRLSTLRRADKIIVLEDGRIVEVGTHNELMERRGKFYDMIQMQADMGTDMLKVV